MSDDNRKLDVEVAVRIMGWRWMMWKIRPNVMCRAFVSPDKVAPWYKPWDGRAGRAAESRPLNYTTDASDANEVVLAMAKRGLCMIVTLMRRITDETAYWHVSICPEGSLIIEGEAEGIGDSPAAFICQAALQAVAAERGGGESNG